MLWTRRKGPMYSIKCLLQTLVNTGSFLVLVQVLFLNNRTIQILPRVFLPNSYTYIDQSSVIYHNDNKILVLRQKEREKIHQHELNKSSTWRKDKEKNKKNKTKSVQYIVYKFNQTTKRYRMKDFVRKSILFQHENDKSSFYNGNMSIHNPNPMSYHTVLGSPIYLISAHGRFGSEPENITFYNGSFKHLYNDMLFSNSSYTGSTAGLVNFISHTGWMHESLLQEELKCCLLLKNQSVLSYMNERRMIWYQVKKQPLFATKSYCPIPTELQSEKPIGASLSLSPYDCFLRIFMKIQYPEIRKRGSIAFCAKIAYGPLPANRLIEWLELQKFVGVDRVMIYFYNLNSAVMRVLKMYMDEGFVDLQPFDIPQPDDPKRQVGEKAAQPFIDEQVAVYDCVERLKGFNYVGIIDFDEIVYTGITYRHNLKPLLKYLNRRYPDASGFSFMTEIFVTDWFSGANSSCNSNSPETDASTKLWYPQFVNRTAPMVDRVKNIINTERVVLDSVWTHNFTSLPGYRKYTISSSLGCLKHFRSCREKWIEDGKCFRLRKYRDYTVANLVRNIKNTVHQKRKMTLGP